MINKPGATIKCGARRIRSRPPLNILPHVGVEMLTPGGFYFLFFGVAALVVGILAGLGAGGPLWAQLVVFSVLSVACLFVLRPYLVRWTGSGEQWNSSPTSSRSHHQ